MSILLEDFKRTKKELKYNTNQITELLEELDDERDLSIYLLYQLYLSCRQKRKAIN